MKKSGVPRKQRLATGWALDLRLPTPSFIAPFLGEDPFQLRHFILKHAGYLNPLYFHLGHHLGLKAGDLGGVLLVVFGH